MLEGTLGQSVEAVRWAQLKTCLLRMLLSEEVVRGRVSLGRHQLHQSGQWHPIALRVSSTWTGFSPAESALVLLFWHQQLLSRGQIISPLPSSAHVSRNNGRSVD